jgi:2-iminobutanoate/2-iminopropanoate deaminase
LNNERLMRESITSVPGGPTAIGPYSLAVAASGRFLFVSGMTPMDPSTGKMSNGPIAEQTRIVLSNMKSVVEAAGATLADVVSCRVFLAQLTEKNFAEMNGVYIEFFPSNPPARTTVGAQLLNMQVEIECVVRLAD